MQTQPEAILEILDLIFKWSVVRMADSGNTQFAVKLFDFYASLFSHLQEFPYVLQDFEAAVLVPLLCEKTGLNNSILKDKVKRLLRMSFDIYDRQGSYNLLCSHGLSSKNLVAIAECLDELGEFIALYGIEYSNEKEMKSVARMADHPAKGI